MCFILSCIWAIPQKMLPQGEKNKLTYKAVFTRAISGALVSAVSLTAFDARQIDNVFTRPSLSQQSLAPVMGRPRVT